jgi:transposase
VYTCLFGREGGTLPGGYEVSARARAVRLVRGHRGGYPAEYAVIKAVAGRLGMHPGTLRLWVRTGEAGSGGAAGAAADEATKVRGLRRKARELAETREILTAAASFAARGCGPRRR